MYLRYFEHFICRGNDVIEVIYCLALILSEASYLYEEQVAQLSSLKQACRSDTKKIVRPGCNLITRVAAMLQKVFNK